jgi:hypothetical protein
MEAKAVKKPDPKPSQHWLTKPTNKREAPKTTPQAKPKGPIFNFMNSSYPNE